MTLTKLSLLIPKTEVILTLEQQVILGQGPHKTISEAFHPSEPIGKIIILGQDPQIILEETTFSEATIGTVPLSTYGTVPIATIGTVPLTTIGTVPLEAAAMLKKQPFLTYVTDVAKTTTSLKIVTKFFIKMDKN